MTLIEFIKMLIYESMRNKNIKLATLAKTKLEKDFTPDWIAPDELSCALAVSTLLNIIDPRVPIFVGTSQMNSYLKNSSLFEEVPQPIDIMKPGYIVMSATGTNSRPDIMPHGHVGIYADDTNIMSNDSATGLWKMNYTRDSWRNRYLRRGGYPIKIYQFKE